MDYDKELALWAELESEWKKNLPRYSPQELLEIFPEAKEIIPVKISELIDAKHELERTIKKNISYVRAKHFTSIGKHILRELLKMNKGMKLVKINANISRLKTLLMVMNEQEPKGGVTHEQIQAAKNASLVDIAKRYFELKKAGKRYWALCPFHKENKASFIIDPEKNIYKCFSCNEYGDSINFVMKIENLNFIEAVRRINAEI